MYKHVRMCVCMCMRMYAYVNICTYVYICVYVCVFVEYIYMHLQVSRLTLGMWSVTVRCVELYPGELYVLPPQPVPS